MIKKSLFVRLSELELEILKTYCEQTDRAQSDVIRDFVRSRSPEIVSLTPHRGGSSEGLSIPSLIEAIERGASGDELNATICAL